MMAHATIDGHAASVYLSVTICPPFDTPKGLGRGYLLVRVPR
jgi:hypothetical protein